MSQEHSIPGAAIDRLRELAAAFVKTDLVRLRVEREGEAVELRRSVSVPAAAHVPPVARVSPNGISRPVETIKADLVGVFHLSRPMPQEGERLEADRELAYVEALGIRNPVRSLGGGRISAIRCRDGEAVEYGQPLFEIERK